jgi:ribosome-associated protein
MATKKPATTGKASAKKAAAPKKTAKPGTTPAKATATKTVKKAAKAVKTAAAKTTTRKTPAKPAAVKTVPAKTTASKKAAAPKAKKIVVNDPSLTLADSVVNGILEKKGENIVCLDLRNIENAVCSFFIICEGNSDTQVEAIAESVEFIVKKETGQRPYRSEGWENALWVLIDYIDVVVHVFERETRSFYNLERLWADAGEILYSPKGERLN